MNTKVKGSICGIIAAITYGLNPLGALNLYSGGINVDSVMFYRYGLAMLLLSAVIIVQKKSFKINSKECLSCTFLGIIFAIASITLFSSFHYMDSGIACTLLFIYPVIVALIMVFFFKEKITLIIILSIIMTLMGVIFLYYDGSSLVLNMTGVLLVAISALTYGIYIVAINKSGIDLAPIQLTFYVMLFGVITIFIHSLSYEEYHLQLLTTTSQWAWAMMLALIPTVISLILMTIAIKNIGSTPAAIMGALEPVTAVMIGMMVFNEQVNLRIVIGILLILIAVFLVTIEGKLSNKLFKKIKIKSP